jgi:hypothetical protein
LSAELKARILAAASAVPSSTRVETRRRSALVLGLAVASGIGSFAIFVWLASDGQWLRLGGEVAAHRHLERSAWLVVTTAGGALGVAASCLWLALHRGGSMLGRSRSSLLLAIAATPTALLVWKLGASFAFGDPLLDWPARPGLRCLGVSLLVAIAPLLAFLAARRSAVAHAALNGAAMGVASGACAWVALDLWCPVASVSHLLLGHVLPIGVLAAVGALLGERLLSLRVR